MGNNSKEGKGGARGELLKRTLSGVIFVVITLVVTLAHPTAYLLLFALYLLCIMIEYLRLTMGEGKRGVKLTTCIAGLLLFFLFASLTKAFDIGKFPTPLFIVLFSLFLTAVVLIPVTNLFSGSYRGAEGAFATLVYVALPFALLNILYGDGWKIASILIILWVGDVGAYVLGTAFGQGERGHKLMPSISPKKSWEGIGGGVLFVAIAALILFKCGVLLDSLSKALLFALFVFVAGVLGDLAESQLKRSCGVKDSGKIMPGHGGALDRFDGALLAFPVAIILYLFLN